jgi:hypothetical protein
MWAAATGTGYGDGVKPLNRYASVAVVRAVVIPC